MEDDSEEGYDSLKYWSLNEGERTEKTTGRKVWQRGYDTWWGNIGGYYICKCEVTHLTQGLEY